MINGCVAVLMGGPSAEHDVSVLSGQMAARALRQAGLRVVEVLVRDKTLELPEDCAVVFIALHGAFGEDGQVQRLLEQRGIPYTGSGPAASALAFDKAQAKTRFVQAGIPTPVGWVLERDFSMVDGLELPAVVKPVRQGSSVGVSIARTAAELRQALMDAWRYDSQVLVEQYIAGREFTVGVLDDVALPVVEIRVGARDGFFNYRAKYTPGRAEEICPAQLDAVTTSRLQTLALRAHECLGCRDMSRTDILMNEAGELFVLEVNTIPGLTPTSLLPRAAAAAGLSFPQLCLRLVELALARGACVAASGADEAQMDADAASVRQPIMDRRSQTAATVTR